MWQGLGWCLTGGKKSPKIEFDKKTKLGLNLW